MKNDFQALCWICQRESFDYFNSFDYCESHYVDACAIGEIGMVFAMVRQRRTERRSAKENQESLNKDKLMEKIGMDAMETLDLSSVCRSSAVSASV